MLIDTTVHLPVSLAMLDGIFKAPDIHELARITFRWFHFVAGVTWIGLLYFFNLVNVPLQKKLDPETKKKVNPDLLLPAYYSGRNLAESYYLSMRGLSWQNIVIGDPLCSLGKPGK